MPGKCLYDISQQIKCLEAPSDRSVSKHTDHQEEMLSLKSVLRSRHVLRAGMNRTEEEEMGSGGPKVFRKENRIQKERGEKDSEQEGRRALFSV